MIVCPAESAATLAMNSSVELIVCPSTAVIRSPGSRPAREAGEFGTIACSLDDPYDAILAPPSVDGASETPT